MADDQALPHLAGIGVVEDVVGELTGYPEAVWGKGGQVPRDQVDRPSATPLDAAVAALGGWQTRAALEQFRWSWSEDLSKLADYLTKVGDGLRECASDYRSSDEASAARFDIRGR
ncbi:hypothetical protein ACTMSW_02150 [Micromonospora sp. BQ11]|uniref:hypothetical protein n=1 Tax=Micromonospora sp. BQ11 TaxID=3452212 RepID=UPI003F89BFA4